jgi:dTDP-4-dehydrorhamnose 3,5-epimerase
MNKFIILDTPLKDLKVIERKSFIDGRGFLARIFCGDALISAGWKKPIAQINHTMTKRRGAVRGMHYQNAPYSEMKLVSCLRGEVWDVAIDLRKNSPTFLKWHAEKLSPINSRALLIPNGFAHGFQSLHHDCELLYLHSAPYASAAEAGISPRDPVINIKWPLEISEISVRDSQFPFLKQDFTGLEL